MGNPVIDKILNRNNTPSKDSIQSILLGFGHRARSGKDTAAAMIKRMRNLPPNDPGRGIGLSDHELLYFNPQYDIRIYSFAGELKREVNECAMKSGGMIQLFNPGLYDESGGFLQENGNILRLPEWVQYDPDPDMTDPLCPYGKQRTLLQWWGTEYRRSINPDYWVKALAKRIAKEKPEIALITDVRFPNEVQFIQRYGEAIKVERPDLPSLKGAAGAHASELALIDFAGWDAVIKNDSTLEVLRERALFTFDMLMSVVPTPRPTSE